MQEIMDMTIDHNKIVAEVYNCDVFKIIYTQI